ncbi:MAG: phosphatidylserine decarboxylase [Kiritimatiellaeota bacterium]|nr:phosphatidylserine decarboxylase [Kiritimatiellota bacterium]
MGVDAPCIGSGASCAPTPERVSFVRWQGVGVFAVYVYATIPENAADGRKSRVTGVARCTAPFHSPPLPAQSAACLLACFRHNPSRRAGPAGTCAKGKKDHAHRQGWLAIDHRPVARRRRRRAGWPCAGLSRDASLLVAGADGLVRAVEDVREEQYLKADTVRISIFLNPFNVHVNRAPMGGTVTALAYTPGKHLLTYSNAASEWNEHSAILIEGNGTRCLVKQIVGPIVRRVVYWLELQQQLVRGERIGMMKFGSRLDMYFPKADVQVLVKKGDRVRAGETVVAQLHRGRA